MGMLIKNGTLVTAADTFAADLLIEEGVIALIGSNLNVEGHTVVDANGKLLLPGGIDVHTHLDLPFGGTSSSDDFFTGHRAAAFGGTTSHIDFVIQPIGGSLHDGLATWREKATGPVSGHAIDCGHFLPEEAPDATLKALLDFL